MDKLRRYKGITLISLIITIIILIILAGISISMLLGNEGLLNKAKYATESYSNAQQQEELELAKYSNNINSYVSGNRDYETEINALKTRIQELENINSYSTDAKVVGTWTDGKEIYRKVIFFSSISSGSNIYVDIGDNVENYINVYGKAADGTGLYRNIPGTHVGSTGFQFALLFYTNNATSNANKIRISVGSSDSTTGGYLIVEYTRTANTSE